MKHSEVVERLIAALEPVAAAHDFELVGVEQAGGRGMPLLRVLLDREGGLDLDTVASANSWVVETIDAVDPFNSPYTLEVSSPGIDRPLTKRADFTRFAGQTVTVKCAQAGEKRQSWTGELTGIEGDNVVLVCDGQTVELPYETIQKARLKGAVDFGKGREQSA